MPLQPSDLELARSIVSVLGNVTWEAVAFAHGIVALDAGRSPDEAARVMFSNGYQSLRKSKEMLERAKTDGFAGLLTKRVRTGSAANPITKMFPGTITEQRFVERLDELVAARSTVTYSDERESGHTLTDFTVREADAEVPVNIKNAGTRFAQAQQLVGLDPDDCIPIPAYKAYAAIEKAPNLLYVVAPDYELIAKLNEKLPTLLDAGESQVWRALNEYAGARVTKAEDAFVTTIVKKHWDQFRTFSTANFHVVSARKVIRILQTKPQRTPGIGLKAWGTGASGETNVHVSIKDEMTAWGVVEDRIKQKGVIDIVGAVNRKRQEWVYDPEI
jgi:hypothetical protein